MALTEVIHGQAVLELDDSPVVCVRDADAAAQAPLVGDLNHLQEERQLVMGAQELFYSK